MSHAFPDDATVASHVGIAFASRPSASPVSWRLAVVIIGGLSTAGWIAVAMTLHRLIG